MSTQPENPYQSPTSESVPPSQASDGELATRGERFAGAFIDGLIVGPLGFGAGMLLGVVLVSAGLDPQSWAFHIASTVIGALGGVAIFLLINGYLLAHRGQTVGKVFMKTKIVSDDGVQLPFGPLILKRYVPFWVVASIPVVGGLFSLVDSVAIFRGNRKCIHDEIASTKVIKLSPRLAKTI